MNQYRVAMKAFWGHRKDRYVDVTAIDEASAIIIAKQQYAMVRKLQTKGQRFDAGAWEEAASAYNPTELADMVEVISVELIGTTPEPKPVSEDALARARAFRASRR